MGVSACNLPDDPRTPLWRSRKGSMTPNCFDWAIQMHPPRLIFHRGFCRFLGQQKAKAHMPEVLSNVKGLSKSIIVQVTFIILKILKYGLNAPMGRKDTPRSLVLSNRGLTAEFPNKIMSGQKIIFHQPRFFWNKGISLPELPFRVRSWQVPTICQDNMKTHENPDIPYLTDQQTWVRSDFWLAFPLEPLRVCLEMTGFGFWIYFSNLRRMPADDEDAWGIAAKGDNDISMSDFH